MNISSIYRESLFGVQQRLVLSLTRQQRMISGLALLALSFLTTSYLLYKLCFKDKKIHLEHSPHVELRKNLDRLSQQIVTQKRKEGANGRLNEEIPSDKKEISSLTTHLLDKQPNDILILIFCELDLQGWKNLSLTNKKFHFLSKDSFVLASLLEKSSDIPFSKQLEFAKVVGFRLTKINFDSSISLQELINLLTACPNIQELDLSTYDNLTDAVISQLPKGLVSLNLRKCVNLTDEAIPQLPARLTSLNLENCYNLMNIPQLPQELITLNLAGCERLANEAIFQLPSSLTSLNLAECKNLTDVAIFQLPSRLTSLNLTRCKNLTDAVIAHLPSGLTSLNLFACNKLTSAAIVQLPSGLTSLSLFDCNKLTNIAMIQLPQGLISLDLSWCDNLTCTAIPQLPSGLKSLNLWPYCSPDFIKAARLKLPHITING